MVQIANCPECEREVAVTGSLSSDEETLARCPLCDAEFLQSRISVRDVPELIVAPAAAPESGEESAAPTDESQELEAVGATPEQPPEKQLDEQDEQSPIDMPVITSSARQDYEGEIRTESRAARANGSPSLLRQMMGIVGGGVVGLAVGYFILLWIGGPERDFLKLGHRLPPWAVPADFHEPVEPPLRAENGKPSLADLLQEEVPQEDVADALTEPEGLPPEPPPIDAAASPEPAAEVDEIVVLDPPELDTADLESALQRAIKARPSLTLATSDDPTQAEAFAAYQAFAALAEAFTFAHPSGQPEEEHEQLMQKAEQLMRDALTGNQMVGVVGPLAARWLDLAGRDHGGIVAAGLVIGSHLGIQKQPGIIVELAGTRRTVAVVGPAAIPVPVGSRVLVVGAVVDRPRERIGGYVGSAPQVVWATLVEPVGR